MLREILEQPAAIRRLLDHSRPIAEVAEVVGRQRPTTIRLVAHGSSDNAASFAVYAFRLAAGIDAIRDSISLPVYYGADSRVDSRVDDSVVLAISQSGRTPDVVSYVERAASHGALTVAITNDEDSHLAQAAHLVIPLSAGEERSLPATKTYLNQIAAIALLAAFLGNEGDAMRRSLEREASRVEHVLTTVLPAVEAIAGALASVNRLFLIARGLEYATAREGALKLTEMANVLASPLTATDFCHGPVAAAGRDLPVWAIASDPQALPALMDAAERVRRVGGMLVASGSLATELRADHVLRLPPADTALLAPLLSILPLQLFAWALCCAKGIDPDRASSALQKVTLVR